MSIAAKSGLGILLASLNRAALASGHQFSDTDLSFSAVEVSTNPAKESQVTYTATPASTFEGSEVAFFNRLDLTTVFTTAGIASIEMTKGFTTTGEVVAALNARFGTEFDATDIDFNGVIDPELDTSVILMADAGSYGFQGMLEVQLVEQQVPLAEAVVDPVLDGPAYSDVTPVDSEAQPA